jgi:hypothetical protein
MSLLNSVNNLTLITNGDSWTFGSEIAAPEIIEKNPNATHVCQYDFYADNDYYRVPRIYPTYLGELLGADVVNLAWPADDNGSILRRTLNYLTKNYIEPGVSTDNIFVVVGWSSPERNSFWFKDGDHTEPFRLWPNVPAFTHKAQEKIWELYVAYLWNPEEYIPRFIMNCIQLENFCVKHKIKHLQFNAFYQSPKTNIDRWQELNIRQETQQLKADGYMYTDSSRGRCHQLSDYSTLWSTVDPVRFYRKDAEHSTFKSFIDNCGIENPYCTQGQGAGWHPSPAAHHAWADELQRYIKEHNLL